MFDIGWTELLVIAVVLIVVVGPKDLPPMLRAFGKMTQRARKVAGEFRAQFDEALREAELDDVRQTISDAQKLNPVNSLREAMNPLRQMGNEIKADLQKSTVVTENKTEVPAAVVSAPTPSMSLPETPPLVPAPAQPEPVAAAAVQADTVAAKPKPVRKPRVKAADKIDAAAAVAVPVEKPKRATAARKPATPKKPAQTKKDEA
ncbi:MULTISPECIES: Sec-independent protein translocase protein TatB [Rhizobium]|jgi:sec-independent protein translocase protein TatB|uniref:Sec-independent protein translocase protein TatB n=1 Tax=Rhizobium TaxID=379 RepID=UPI0007B52C68|nr:MULTISPECIES: Sec-independent protein translocase protein TatB [Rhizobium]KZS51356.1 preprotein translocase [Rhizobium anhuiense bv. trifolii]MBB3299710.1 sec-independent protein translocase protein TatB [Rhizobium sp. BK112]MBB3369022.1 sec-independent protein translocase protein TatB [Rhizobium sp. BK077]MBB4179600.1 sec-independent protein translocase protein TatB [Rhizobium sp. BK109]NKM55835.1 twin-arginine translocase subunit TatB [Rhizobium anhuiense]